MTRSLLLLPLALLLLHCNRAGNAGAVAEETAERQLLWADEFDGDSLSTADWNFELGDGCPNLCGWGNNERQSYTRSNHRLEDGHLIITARKEGTDYTSTRITTKDKQAFQYGRIETRAKLPVGEGLWPAFWMLGENIGEVGWPLCGEIDILEYVGREPGEIFTTLHTQANHGDNGSSKTTAFPDIEEGFHRYAAEWTAEQITFYVDDQLVFTFDPEQRTEAVWPFDQPFYIILNVAVGGNFGGPEVDDTVFPQEFVVDYVRVYAPL
ncbi:Beta-glucanase [Neolewinella maritima]|uniref:Beta-glucanase n=1 Tax=Neolewinella maritima TaxID=1383882 RepID=A0ABM9AXB5_9BACT|nr:glycoside hydrolase family 16 protein [Neolewinella maritima]CAH0998865.1 Beta-glucanase [Neolewinella maritima]